MATVLAAELMPRYAVQTPEDVQKDPACILSMPTPGGGGKVKTLEAVSLSRPSAAVSLSETSKIRLAQPASDLTCIKACLRAGGCCPAENP